MNNAQIEAASEAIALWALTSAEWELDVSDADSDLLDLLADYGI